MVNVMAEISNMVLQNCWISGLSPSSGNLNTGHSSWHPPQLRTETDPVILSVIHHRQNSLHLNMVLLSFAHTNICFSVVWTFPLLWKLSSSGIQRRVWTDVSKAAYPPASSLDSCSADFLPLRWRWYIPQKRWLTYGLHGTVFQKMETFITTVVRTSNPKFSLFVNFYLGTHLKLVLRLRMTELYLHSPVRIHSLVLN
jgi:hypothetical protein